MTTPLCTPGVEYGPGGYLPDHPSGNVKVQVVDNGDGTGVRTVYDPDGQVTSTDAVTCPALAPADPVSAVIPVEAVLAARAALKAAGATQSQKLAAIAAFFAAIPTET